MRLERATTGAAGRTSLVRVAGALVCAGMVPSTWALDLSSRDSDWKIRLDTTVKYSSGDRLKNQDPALIGTTPPGNPFNVNMDDGDRNFDKGLASNRLDLLGEFDVQRQGTGLRVSAAGWYDARYDRPTSQGTLFPAATKKWAGAGSEILDLFAFGRYDLDDKRRLSVRAGQFTQLWGSTLFFAANGIAKGMAPVDVYKINIPGSQAKEYVLPVPQLSANLSLSDVSSVDAYVQFKFRPNRLAPSGSYFSTTDWLGEGSSVYRIPFGATLQRAADMRGANSPNFGLAFNTRSETLDTDFGIHLLRYRDTSPQTVVKLNNAFQPSDNYYLAYPGNIKMLGLSFGRLVGDANVSGELSARWNQPLAPTSTSNGVAAFQDAYAVDLSDNGMWPTGRTLHFNVSTVWIGSSTPAWDSVSVVGEFMANRVMSVSRNENHLDTTKRRSAAAARVIFSPTYYQVLPGLDLSPSVNVGWAFRGSSMIDGGALPFGGSPDKGGDVVLGVSGTFHAKYKFDLSWINYVGKAATQKFLDRDIVRFSMQTSL